MLYVFMPPLDDAEDYLDARRRGRGDRDASPASPCVIEGYQPPNDPRAST